jgi:hypothetical protein
MTTFAKAISGTVIGGTADTFDTVGTITLSDKAVHVHGLLVVWAESSARTADEGTHAQVRWSSGDNGIGNQIFSCLGGAGAGPATNIAAVNRQQLYLPLDIPVAGNSKFDFEFTTHTPDPTGTNDVAISLLFNDGDMGEMSRFYPGMVPSVGQDSEANAAVTATTETAITNLEVPGWASYITGFYFQCTPEAMMTDADPVVPIFILRSSMRDFDPQEYIGNSIATPLGTPVGNGLMTWGIPIPVWIPTNSTANQTITPNVKLTVTSASNIACLADVYYK